MKHASWKLFLAAVTLVSFNGIAHAAFPAEANLISYWQFNGSAVDSVGSNHGTVYGDAHFVSGIASQSLDCDGDSDYVRIPDDDSLTPRDEITIAYWIYYRGGQRAGIYKTAWCPGESASPGNSRSYHLAVENGNDKVRAILYQNAGTYDYFDSNSIVPFNEWHHVAMTFNRGQGKIYLDGIENGAKTLSITSLMNDVHPLYIGGFWDYCGTDNWINGLNGLIDNLCIYNKALSAEEIQELYRLNSKIPQRVRSHQKISDTEGGFTGILDNNDYWGRNVSSIGDLDGDGVVDLAVGSRYDDDGGTDRGAVWILFLNSDGTVKNHQKISDTEGDFTGTLSNDGGFGYSFRSIGDLDVDGVTDIVVATMRDDDNGTNAGAIWVLFLNSNGTVKSHQKITENQGGFTGNLDSHDWFGSSISLLDDLDGDGVDDLAVGAAGDDDGGIEHGAVWILFMNTDGTVKSYQKISDTQGGFTGVLDQSDFFGNHQSAGISDLDGDGITELAVTANNDDDSGTDSGAIWILFLNANGTVKAHQKITENQGGFNDTLSDLDHFGAGASAVGDIDADGISDLIVGSARNDDGGTNRGAFWILFLNSNGTVKDHRKISDTSGNFQGDLDDEDNFGCSLTCPGDLDGDGCIDFIAGAWGDDDGGTGRGAVYVLFMEPEQDSNVFHVDGVSGSDFYDGLTKETAFATIQKGINEANDGYTINVWPGDYNEAVVIDGKVLTLRSANEPAVIQASGDEAVSIYNVNDSNCVIKNFILRNSDVGVFLVGGYPILQNLTIVNNNYGVKAQGGADPVIKNCILYNNATDDLYQCDANYSWIEDEITSPIAYWKLDEASGSTAYDSAGTYNGTIYGATPTEAVVDGAFEFDGYSDYIIFGDILDSEMGNAFTIGVWIKLREGAIQNIIDYMYILWKSDDRPGIRISTDGLVSFLHWHAGTGISVRSINALEEEKWYYLSYVYNGSEFIAYINGKFIGSVTDSGYSPGGTLYIGGELEPSRCFDGIIDEVAIFDQALSENAVRTLYQAGLAGHSIDAGPMFADPNNNDYHLKSSRGRYWPQHDLWVLDKVTSPCVDAGDPAMDPNGESMPNGGRINQGAYGGTAFGSMSEWLLEGDLNLDGKVNFIDYAIMAEKWFDQID